MSLTLALGLKYEPSQREKFSPPRQEETASEPTQTTHNTELKSQDIIDVQAIESKTLASPPTSQKHYTYLSYNMHATLNILHAIGSQLHITI